ncbi:MAG: rod shape-determining protein MreD [Bacillaceae bacterium]
MRHIFYVLLLTIMFICENLFMLFVPNISYFNEFILVPHFLLFTLMFMAVYNEYTMAIVYSIIFGLLFDVVYTEVLGIYVFAYFMIVYLLKQAMRLLHGNLFIVSFLSLCGVALLELYVYSLLSLFGSTNMALGVFWHQRLIPTLLLNTVFVIIFCFPLKKFLVRLKVDFNEK